MEAYKKLFSSIIVFLCILVTGCAVSPPYNYTELQKAKPRSILVIPPQNNTVEVNAPYIFLSTISMPLAEKGYYVYPVSVIDAFLKENGLPTPAEMNSVPLDKIREVIGADAVLYVSINDWGQKYSVLSSETVVNATMRLVDTRTGVLLWDAKASGTYNPNSNNGGGLIGVLVGAVVNQIAGSVIDHTPELSSAANIAAIYAAKQGLLAGPYAPVSSTVQ